MTRKQKFRDEGGITKCDIILYLAENQKAKSREIATYLNKHRTGIWAQLKNLTEYQIVERRKRFWQLRENPITPIKILWFLTTVKNEEKADRTLEGLWKSEFFERNVTIQKTAKPEITKIQKILVKGREEVKTLNEISQDFDDNITRTEDKLLHKYVAKKLPRFGIKL
jgi:hypothetical protein